MKFILLFLAITSMSASRTYNAFSDGNYDAAKEMLKVEQADNPYDGEINYNLGVVEYKQKKFSQAKESFLRAQENLSDNLDLKNKTIFNLANTFYKNTLAILGPNWETKKLQDKTLDGAIEEVTQSINKYKEVLDDPKTKTNKKLAEELLQKLLEKKEQQDNQNDQDNNDDQNDDNKDQDQDNQDNKSQNDNQDQNKNDQDNNSNSDNKNDHNDDEQDQEGDLDQDKQGSNSDDKNDNQSDKDHDKQDDNSSDDNDNSEDEKNEKDNQNVNDHSREQEKKDGELSSMEALLDNVSEGEEKLQKALIKYGVTSNMQMQKPGQKNW